MSRVKPRRPAMPKCVRWAASSAVLLLAACASRTAENLPVEPVAAFAPTPAPAFAFGAIEGVPEQAGFARGLAPPGTLRLTLDGKDVPVAADGAFFVAFPREASSSVLLRAEGGDGVAAEHRLDLRPRVFPEDRLPARLQRHTADPGFAARRAEELARIGAARGAPSSESGWRGGFVLPASGRVSGVFGAQRFYGDEPQSPHSGLDIAAPVGTPVVAPAPGRVVLASPPLFSLEGNLVILDHGQGLTSSFLHLDRVDVAAGQALQTGEIIGAVGATGRATGAHLHWGVMWQGVRFDPATLLSQVLPACC